MNIDFLMWKNVKIVMDDNEPITIPIASINVDEKKYISIREYNSAQGITTNLYRLFTKTELKKFSPYGCEFEAFNPVHKKKVWIFAEF